MRAARAAIDWVSARVKDSAGLPGEQLVHVSLEGVARVMRSEMEGDGGNVMAYGWNGWTTRPAAIGRPKSTAAGGS